MINAGFYDGYCGHTNYETQPHVNAILRTVQDDGFGNGHIAPSYTDNFAFCFKNENVH